jgi:hypothetical protein
MVQESAPTVSVRARSAGIARGSMVAGEKAVTAAQKQSVIVKDCRIILRSLATLASRAQSVLQRLALSLLLLPSLLKGALQSYEKGTLVLL